MKKILLIAVLALSFISLAACTEKTKDSTSSSRPSDDIEMEAGGAYGSDWDNEFELPEDYFN